MRFLIITPAAVGSTKGNRITAERWARIITTLGHQVSIRESFDGKSPNTNSSARKKPPFDVLVALHAAKSNPSVVRFRKKFPASKIVVAFTGTDIHLKPNAPRSLVNRIAQSLKLADQVVLLQPEAMRLISKSARHKTSVIFQSSKPIATPPKKLTRWFEVSVIGHLRPVKDPFRTALAARQLPPNSRVRIVHFGAALIDEMKKTAEKEQRTNPRYRWLGQVTHSEAKRRLSRSRLTVLSSKSEGGPAVISEAIVNDVPILTTRINATIGLLGKGFPGFFEFGNTKQLADLIHRAESDKEFYQSLVKEGKKRKRQFSPAAEKKSWATLIKALANS